MAQGQRSGLISRRMGVRIPPPRLPRSGNRAGVGGKRVEAARKGTANLENSSLPGPLSCGLLSTFYSQALRVREAPQRRNISPSLRVSSSAAAGAGMPSRRSRARIPPDAVRAGYRHGSPLSPRAGMDIAVVAQSVERLFCNQLTGVRFPPTAMSLAARRKLNRMSGGLPNRGLRVRIPSGASGQVA